MRYTLQNGVKSRYSDYITDNKRYLLPLVVILAGLLVFLLAPRHSIKNANPLTLGIYSVKTNDNAGNKNNNDKKSDQKSNTTGTDAQPISAQAGVANVAPVGSSGALGYTTSSVGSTSGATGSTPPITGGMGSGGVTGGGGTGGGITPTTVSCVNQLTGTGTLCVFPFQYCTVPLAGVTGYKTVDGTCIVVN